MATLSSIPAWKSPRTEEPGGLQSMVSQELDTTKSPPDLGVVSKVTNRKHKNANSVVLNEPPPPPQDTCENWNGEAEQPCLTSVGNACVGDSDFSLLCPQITLKMLQILILGLQITFSELVNLQIGNPWMMRSDCIRDCFLVVLSLI